MTLAATTATPATDVRDDERRTRPVWKPLAAAGIGGAVLIATGFGVFATLQATASNTTAQTVSSGTLSLSLASTTGSVGFNQSVSNLAPTDTVHRFVTLTNNGTLAAKGLGLQLAVAPGGSSSLVTDGPTTGAANVTKALRASVEHCSTAWAVTTTNGVTTGACTGGTVTTVLAATPLSGLLAAPLSLGTDERAAGATTSLRITLTLPDQTETVHNGATPAPNAAGTIQNQSAALTWTFSQGQRTAATTSA